MKCKCMVQNSWEGWIDIYGRLWRRTDNIGLFRFFEVSNELIKSIETVPSTFIVESIQGFIWTKLRITTFQYQLKSTTLRTHWLSNIIWSIWLLISLIIIACLAHLIVSIYQSTMSFSWLHLTTEVDVVLSELLLSTTVSISNFWL